MHGSTDLPSCVARSVSPSWNGCQRRRTETLVVVFGRSHQSFSRKEQLQGHIKSDELISSSPVFSRFISTFLCRICFWKTSHSSRTVHWCFRSVWGHVVCLSCWAGEWEHAERSEGDGLWTHDWDPAQEHSPPAGGEVSLLWLLTLMSHWFYVWTLRITTNFKKVRKPYCCINTRNML